jgi:hypothetical protein
MMTKKFFCELIRPGVATANGRIYSKEAVEKLVEMTNKQAEDGHCMVVHDGQPDGRVLLKDVVGLVRKATLEDEKMVCTVEMLATPKAVNLEMLFNDRVSVAPLAYGHVGPDGKVEAESLRIHGWSFILDNDPK